MSKDYYSRQKLYVKEVSFSLPTDLPDRLLFLPLNSSLSHLCRSISPKSVTFHCLCIPGILSVVAPNTCNFSFQFLINWTRNILCKLCRVRKKKLKQVTNNSSYRFNDHRNSIYLDVELIHSLMMLPMFTSIVLFVFSEVVEFTNKFTRVKTRTVMTWSIVMARVS